MTSKRLTKKIGIYKQGKQSETISRAINDEVSARVNQDLRRILELAKTPTILKTTPLIISKEPTITSPFPLATPTSIIETMNKPSTSTRVPPGFTVCSSSLDDLVNNLQRDFPRRNYILFKAEGNRKMEIKNELRTLYKNRTPSIIAFSKIEEDSSEGSIIFTKRTVLKEQSETNETPPSVNTCNSAESPLKHVEVSTSPIIKWGLPDESFLLTYEHQLLGKNSPSTSFLSPLMMESLSPSPVNCIEDKKFIAECYLSKEVKQPFSLDSLSSGASGSADSVCWTNIPLPSPAHSSPKSDGSENPHLTFQRHKMY